MKNISSLRNSLNDLLEYMIEDTVRVSLPQAGVLYLGDDYVVAMESRLADYYLGFEYVDPNCVFQLGEAKVYYVEEDGDRVDDLIQAWCGVEEA